MELYYALLRIQDEYRDWEQNPLPEFSAIPQRHANSTNYMKWMCSVPGPVATPWHGMNYVMEMNFPLQYPRQPPQITFKRSIFHPNVDPTTKDLQISLLKGHHIWTAHNTVKQLLQEIQFVMVNPEFLYEANKTALDTYIYQRDKYDQKVREDVQAFICEYQEFMALRAIGSSQNAN